MSDLIFTVTGGVNVAVTMTENANGTIGVTVNVLNDTGKIGDLNAFYFDIADNALVSTLSATGADVTGTAFKADGVTKISSYTTMSGEVINTYGKFDGGVQFGTSGIGKDDIRTTSFTLSSSAGPLTLDMFAEQDFGIRLTSVGVEGGSRDGSLKLGTTAPELPPDVSAIALNDSMTVPEFEAFNPDRFDFLDFFQSSVLGNDVTTDGAPYAGQVTSVNGTQGATDQIVTGSNGGYLIIHPDGTVDFSALNDQGISEFEYLNTGDEAVTTFTYGIEGGSTATLTVTVLGFEDGGGVGNG
jgi:VCBS repeat-containing protein